MAMRYAEMMPQDQAKRRRNDWETGHRLPPVGVIVLAIALLAGCNSGRPPTPYVAESQILHDSRGETSNYGDIFAAKRDIEVHARRDVDSPVIYKLRLGELFYAHEGIAINPDPTPVRVKQNITLDSNQRPPVTAKPGETAYLVYTANDLFDVWFRGEVYSLEEFQLEESFAPPQSSSFDDLWDYLEGHDNKTQEWVFAENVHGYKGWFTIPKEEFGHNVFDHLSDFRFGDHDWLVLQPGEQRLLQQWRTDGTLTLSLQLLDMFGRPKPSWRLSGPLPSRVLLNYPAAPPMIVTCRQTERSAACEIYAFKKIRKETSAGEMEAKHQLAKASRPNAVFIGQEWMILTCSTANDVYDWSSSCTGLNEVHSQDTSELTVVDLNSGKSRRIIKIEDSYSTSRPPHLVPGPKQALPEHLSWVSEERVEYFKDTLAITPAGFSVEVSFPEKVPSIRQRLHVELPAMTITLEPTGTDERNAAARSD
jgi:hypothetical protein